MAGAVVYTARVPAWQLAIRFALEVGALPALRVSNSIRMPAAALARGALPEQFAMRAQADELERLRIRFPVDEQEVRP